MTNPLNRIELEKMRAPGWQPIETAPRDGTLILLFCDHHDGDPEWRIGHYDQAPFGKPGPFGRYVWQMQDDGGCFAEQIVTHWMPLPDPPE
jgi:hypothetical protein